MLVRIRRIMSIIQQLEDLKEWSQDSTRYERRLAFPWWNTCNLMGIQEGGTIPIEWDELSDRESRILSNRTVEHA